MTDTEHHDGGDESDGEVWARTFTPDFFDPAFNSVVRANRAALTSFGLRPPELETGSDVSGVPEEVTEDWSVSRDLEEPGYVEVGDVIEFSKVLTDEDVHRFAVASGDTNPLHLDPKAAEETRFDERIVHGTLVSGLISAALARLPGTVIYVSQDTRFLGPVKLDDRVTAVCEIVEKVDDDMYRLSTDIRKEDGETVVEGEAVVLIDDAEG